MPLHQLTRTIVGLTCAVVMCIPLLAACAAPPASTATLLPTTTQLAPSATIPQPSATPTKPPSTHTPEPSATDTASPSPSPTTIEIAPTPTTTLQPGAGTVVGSVLFFLIRKDTGGPICGDSVIPVGTTIKRTGDVARDVAAGLTVLLSIQDKWVGDLYNPLNRARIKVKDVYFNPDNGLISVFLRGTYPQPGDPCENTRVREIVWATVRQFDEVVATNIILNTYPFGDKLSNGK